jgi:hypothetical protein
MEIKRSLGEPDFLGNIRGGRGPKTLFPEEDLGRVKELLTAGFRRQFRTLPDLGCLFARHHIIDTYR